MQWVLLIWRRSKAEPHDTNRDPGLVRIKIRWSGSLNLCWGLMLGSMLISKINFTMRVPRPAHWYHQMIAFNTKIAKPSTSVPSGMWSIGKRPRSALNKCTKDLGQIFPVVVQNEIKEKWNLSLRINSSRIVICSESSWYRSEIYPKNVANVKRTKIYTGPTLYSAELIDNFFRLLEMIDHDAMMIATEPSKDDCSFES